VALPLKVDPLETARSFVDLKERNYGDPIKDDVSQHELRIAVAEIDRSLEHHDPLAKMRKERTLRLAPPDVLKQTCLRLRKWCRCGAAQCEKCRNGGSSAPTHCQMRASSRAARSETRNCSCTRSRYGSVQR
jgi:hypothetical protein